MGLQPIPFAVTQSSGLEQLAGASPLIVNALAEATGTIRNRPGISAWSPFPTAIPDASAVMGMVAFGSTLVYVTEDRRLWALPVTGTVAALSTGPHPVTDGTTLDGGTRPSLLATHSRVVAAGGGLMQTWTGSGYSSRLANPSPLATSVCGIATRVVASLPGAGDGGVGDFQWSLPFESGHTTWDPLNFRQVGAKPDPLVAIADNTNELFAFGTQTLEVYSPDPYIGFAQNRVQNVGCLAAGSIVAVDDLFAFLDRERRFIITDGRSFGADNILSTPIARTLRERTVVSDTWGFRMKLDRWDAPVWFMPTDGKGYMYDIRGAKWAEWRAWGDHGYEAASITCAMNWPEQNVFLVGLSTGQIAKLDATAYDDLGEIIKVEVVSGFVNHSTDNLKKSNAVNFVFRRGETAQSGTAPKVHVSWRDDLGSFCTPEVFDLGLAGDYEVVLPLRSTGVYRRRQWKIEFTAAAEFSFVGAQEEFDVLGN